MRLRTELAPAIACAAAGVLIATLPHLSAWSASGDPAWISDHDERFYLAVASQAAQNHPARLADPVRASGGPSLYRPLPLLPGVWAARLIGARPLDIGLIWRLGAGATIGLAWYALLRLFEPRPWIAAGLAVVLVADGGLLEGRPVVAQAGRAVSTLTGRAGTAFDGKPMFHPQWRVTTPAVTMAYLVLLIWAVARARGRPTRGRIALAGLAFGLLFYVYFYYWTAAGLALLIALALDAGHRRVYLHAGWVGALVGLPAVVADALLKRATAADWLHRTDKFLPIGRFDELLVPKATVALLAVGLAWTLARRRDLAFVWSLAAAGLLLTNHQVLTGLQIENFHWVYVWGPAASLLTVLALAGGLGRLLGRPGDPPSEGPDLRPGATARFGLAVGLLAATTLGPGLWLRAVEAGRSRDSADNARAIARYLDDRSARRAATLEPNAVVAGDGDFVDLAAIVDNLRPLSNYWVTLSPTVLDADWDDRAALNAYLLGLGRAAFEADQRAWLDKNAWGPWARDPARKADRLRARLDRFDRVAADPRAALDRHRVRYLALPDGAPPGHLGDGWARVEDGAYWDLWARQPGRVAAR